MKIRIIVEGDYNDAAELKNQLGNIHKSEFHFESHDEAKKKLIEISESLSNKKKEVIKYPNTLMYGKAKAQINIY